MFLTHPVKLNLLPHQVNSEGCGETVVTQTGLNFAGHLCNKNQNLGKSLCKIFSLCNLSFVNPLHSGYR